MKGPMGSIRKTLLGYLLLGLAAVVLLATWFTYNETLRQVSDLFDLQLKQLAYSTRIDDLLRGRQPSLDSFTSPSTAGVSEIVTQIWDRDGVLVYWSRPGAGLPVPATEGYSNVRQGNREWRVYTHVAGTYALQVAHSLDETQEVARSMALRTMLPLAALIPILGVVIWWAVGVGLKPLEAISRAVAKRRPDAMAPLPERELPDELRPLVTSLNALLGRLDAALSAQRRFTADAAHELRTPLAALKLQVELAARAASADERNAALGELEQGVDRAAHLVEQLLTMARLEPEGPGHETQRIDLAQVVREAVVARSALAGDKQIDLGLARAQPVDVRGDRAGLSILVGNLLDNALRYTPVGGRIDVAVEPANDGGRLMVSDTGPGIAPADRERVFERFYRVRAPGDTVGSGLGLSIVRRIAAAHGAKVELDDGPDGRGLTVRVSFPPASQG